MDIDDKLLERFLENNCSLQEMSLINRWLEEDPNHGKDLFELEEKYNIGKLSMVDRSAWLSMAEAKLDRTINKKRTALSTLRFAAIALALFVVSSSAFMLIRKQEIRSNTIIAHGTDNKELILPDGTKVWLGKNATLSYPKAFPKDKREVTLVGDAYFEVEKNPSAPFIANNEFISVKVYGTKFNLDCREEESIAQASLVEGEIEVKGNNNEGMIVLEPGQRAELNRNTGKMVVKQINFVAEDIFKNNMIPFANATFLHITQTLEQVYDVNIVLSKTARNNKTYSGAIVKKSNVEAVLHSLQNSIPFTFTREDDNIFISMH